MNINDLFDDLEKLKKEVWYLIKKVIPKIEETIENSALGDISNIKNQLSQCLEEIDGIKTDISTLTNSTNNVTLKVSELESSFSNLSNTLNSLSSTISSLSEITDNHSQQLDSINSEVSSLKSSYENISPQIDLLNSIVNKHSENILSLTTTVGQAKSLATEAKSATENFSTNLTIVSNSVANNTSKINELESFCSSINNSISSINSSVSALSDSLSSLETDVNNLKTENCTVIYDMSSEDSSINLGFTTGMTGTKYISHDFSQYHTIRIYARLYASNCVQEIPVKNRKVAQSAMIVTGSNPIIISSLNILFTIEPLLNRLQVGAYGKYTFSSATGTFILESGSSNTNFYVYRVEGIKK